MEKRFTPARLKSFNFVLPSGVGLTSSETSASSARLVRLEIASKMSETVEWWARLGVPPPKNTEVTLQGQSRWNDRKQVLCICGTYEKALPGHLTELQQCVHLLLKTLAYYVVVVIFGDVLIKVAVRAPFEAIGPLEERRGILLYHKWIGVTVERC